MKTQGAHIIALKVTLSKEVTVRGGCLLDMTFYPFDSQVMVMVMVMMTDMTFYLFDSQTCHLSFGSWSRGLDSLDLVLASNNITTSYLYARSSGEKQKNSKIPFILTLHFS